MVPALKPQRGRPTLRRLEFSQAFLARLRESGRRGRQLATLGGFPHYSSFSALLHRRTIPGAPNHIRRFFHLADALGFERQQVFREVGR